ncbi:hypothetical protein ACFLUB_02515 [Chloroflexota bacterium]
MINPNDMANIRITILNLRKFMDSRHPDFITIRTIFTYLENLINSATGTGNVNSDAEGEIINCLDSLKSSLIDENLRKANESLKQLILLLNL